MKRSRTQICRCDATIAHDEAASPLQELFDRCRTDRGFLQELRSDPYQLRYRQGLDMPDNVIVRVRDGSPADPRLGSACTSCQQAVSSLTFVLGLSTCEEPDLADSLDWG